MNRLTKSGTEEHVRCNIENGCTGICGNCPRNTEIRKKLRHYENLEEQNKLMELPCEVGDTVWELCKCDDGVYRIFPMNVAQVVPFGSVRWVKGKKPTLWNIYAVSDYTDMYKNFYDFGRTVFLTEEDAKQALRSKLENKTELMKKILKKLEV